MKVCGEALECADRLRIALRRDGNDVKRRPHVQAGGILVHQGQLSLATLASFRASHLYAIEADAKRASPEERRRAVWSERGE